MASKSTINKRVNIYINGREVGNDIKSIRAEMQKAVNEIAKMTRGSEQYNAKAKEIRTLKSILQEHNQQLRTTQQRWSGLGSAGGGIKKYFGMLTAWLASITGLVFGLKKISDEIAQLDDLYSDVSKTTNLTRNEVVALNESFKKMDTRTSREELNRLAADAGKLGITGKKDILDFVDAGNQINVALGEDLGEGAIKNIGKLSQVFQASTRELKNMSLKQQMLSIGSAINELGQSSTASEAYLVNFAQRLGGVASQAGISIQNILGYASALDQSGQAAEMSATALQNFIMKLMADPAKFAKLAGQEVHTFTELLKTDTNAAILQVLSAMNSKGGFQALIPMFQEMGLDGARAVGVLSALATNIDKVTEAQTVSNRGFAEAVSITGEYEKKNNNMQAALEKARKEFREQALTLGEKLVPIVLKCTNGFTAFMKVLVKLPAFYDENKRLIHVLAAALIVLQGKTILATIDSLKSRTAHLLEAAAKKKNAAATAYLSTYAEQYRITQGNVSRGVLKLRTSFSLLWKTIVANPIGAIVTGIYALVAAVNFMEKHTDNAIRAERLKNNIMTASETATKLATEANNGFAKSIQNLNRLSSEERRHLREQISDRIKLTEATLNQLEAEQAELKQAASKATFWQSVKNAFRTTNVGGSVSLPTNNISAFNQLQETDAQANGEKASAEMDESIQKVRDSLTGLKEQLNGLNEIFNAEINADKIGTKTIIELQEKVNLYRTALENATLESEDYERIQKKLISTEEQLNKAIKEREIPDHQYPQTENQDNQKKEQAEKKLAEAITVIRQKLNLDSLSASEKEIVQAQQKYAELLRLCKQFGLDSTEVYDACSEEIGAIIDREMENEVSAFITAQDQINQALMPSSEQQKASVRQKYEELIALAEQHEMDTVALKQKMDEELAAIKEDEEPRDIFGMSPEDWEELEGKIGMAIDLAGQLSNIWGQFNQIKANQEKKELQDFEKDCNRKKELLNKQLNAGKISQEQYNARVSQLDADMDKKKTEIAKRQAKRDKALAITNAIINTASAIMRIWADVPKVDFGVSTAILTALAAATGAAQIAVIASQPLPEYAIGGLTDGAKMYIAGEAGQEWISPNWMLKDKTTGPIIKQLEMVRSGILSPDQLVPLAPDFQTMTSIPMFADGGYTSKSEIQNNYYTTETNSVQDNEYLEKIDQNIRTLCEYLSDPRNRQAVISNDLLERNTDEMRTINRLKRL